MQLSATTFFSLLFLVGSGQLGSTCTEWLANPLGVVLPRRFYSVKVSVEGVLLPFNFVCASAAIHSIPCRQCHLHDGKSCCTEYSYKPSSTSKLITPAVLRTYRLPLETPIMLATICTFMYPSSYSYLPTHSYILVPYLPSRYLGKCRRVGEIL